jgi:hypothetical protein
MSLPDRLVDLGSDEAHVAAELDAREGSVPPPFDDGRDRDVEKLSDRLSLHRQDIDVL